MELILTKSVDKLGERGSTVRVADGYGRNYLLPMGYAILATKGARKQADSMRRSEERREQARRDAAGVERDRLHGKSVTCRVRANAQGKLYGAVSARDIVEALHDTHGVTADAAHCHIAEPIREVGSFTVSFSFYKDIAAEVAVTVKAVEGDAPAEAAVEEPSADDIKRAPKPKPIITGGARED